MAGLIQTGTLGIDIAVLAMLLQARQWPSAKDMEGALAHALPKLAIEALRLIDDLGPDQGLRQIENSLELLKTRHPLAFGRCDAAALVAASKVFDDPENYPRPGVAHSAQVVRAPQF